MQQSVFLKALRREAVDHTPVWFMRQAGRYMPEYRAVREQYSMLDCIRTPELAARITLQPIQAFAVDAGILFNDILTPLPSMGLHLDFKAGAGPVIDNRLETPRDIDRLATPSSAETMPFTREAIRQVLPELEQRGVPLIGFAGAPFTLASYAVEGGGSKNHERTKRLMYSESPAWHRLMGKLEVVVTDYLLEQVKAGVHAVQVFDSWAGVLSRADYLTFVQPYTARLLTRVRSAGAPVIYFATGSAHLLPDLARFDVDCLGVDWRTPLADAWNVIGHDKSIQGNLDPLLLQAPWRELRHQADQVLREAGGRRGHIFNVGHGLLPQTPPAQVERLVEHVHSVTRRTEYAH